jgi:phosphonate transport system permease protein
MKSRKNQSTEKQSLVSPPVAAILSLLHPGLGHLFARLFGKGFILLFSFDSILGLWLWRIFTVGRREPDIFSKVQKAVSLRPVLGFILMLVILIYFWIAYDAYLSVKKTKVKSVFLFFLVLVAFFALGWQIGEIEPAELIRGGKESLPFLLRVMWPWEKAIYRPEEYLLGSANIKIPCVGTPPEPEEENQGEPYVRVNPTCGTASEPYGGAEGTTLHMVGKNFLPNTETEIWWEDQVQNEWRYRSGGEYISVMTDDEGRFELDVVIPYRVIPSTDEEGAVVWKLKARQLLSLGDLTLSEELKESIEKIIETIFLGMMATFFGVIFSIPVSFIASRNLMSANWFTKAIYYVVRTILNIIRSIESMVWAVIAIIAVGLGPFAGIIALIIHSIAALGKLYSEAIESIDSGTVEAIQATGANWLQTVWYGVVPQIIPPFVSFTIYRWDINVRMSTVIGLVGGGGIGYLLIQWIRKSEYDSAGIAIWFIAITVAILDYVSAEIRERFV